MGCPPLCWLLDYWEYWRSRQWDHGDQVAKTPHPLLHRQWGNLQYSELAVVVLEPDGAVYEDASLVMALARHPSLRRVVWGTPASARPYSGSSPPHERHRSELAQRTRAMQRETASDFLSGGQIESII